MKLPHQDKADVLISIVGLNEADCQIDEGTAEAPKREIVLTALKEGAGNPKDKRWYEKSCVEGIEPLVYQRRKIFYNHLAEGRAPASDDLRDWPATVVKTWLVEGEDGACVRKVRLKVHDNWLWERAKDPIARRELALSIEGRGAGREGEKNGTKYTCIESIYWLNAFKLVPYPGNATMGADTVEAAAAPDTKITEEDPAMDPKLITLALLEADRPDLIVAIADKVKAKLAEAAKPDASELESALKTVREEFSAKLEEREKNHAKVVAALETKLVEADKRLDGAEVREKLAAKEVIIKTVLEGAKLPAEAVTERFLARLNAVVEREVADATGAKKTISVREQIEAEVAEMKTLITPKLGAVGAASTNGAPKIDPKLTENLTEADKQWLFEKELLELHRETSIEQYFASKAEAAKK